MKRLPKTLTGLGFSVLRLSKKALAAAQSVSSALSSVELESFRLISLIFHNFPFVRPAAFLQLEELKRGSCRVNFPGNVLKQSLMGVSPVTSEVCTSLALSETEWKTPPT